MYIQKEPIIIFHLSSLGTHHYISYKKKKIYPNDNQNKITFNLIYFDASDKT